MWQTIKDRFVTFWLIVTFGHPELLPPLLVMAAGAATALGQ